jgi:sugar phosphate isomerase/epimerase
VKQDKPLEQTLRDSLPYLFLVTLNGLDKNKIVSLDQGDYDLGAFLKLLKQVGYDGRVGLQGYGIQGPSAEHLKRSMDKWREMMKGLEG